MGKKRPIYHAEEFQITYEDLWRHSTLKDTEPKSPRLGAGYTYWLPLKEWKYGKKRKKSNLIVEKPDKHHLKSSD